MGRTARERKEGKREEDDSWNSYKRISRLDRCKTSSLRFVGQVSIRQFLCQKRKGRRGNKHSNTYSWQAGKKEGRKEKTKCLSMDWCSTIIGYLSGSIGIMYIYQSALHASAKSTLVIYKLVLGSYAGGGSNATGGFLRLVSYIGDGGSGRR